MNFKYYKCRPANHPFPVIAWLIMIFQGQNPFSPFSSSHRALGYRCPKGKMRVVDSTSGEGVQDRSLIAFKKQYHVVHAVELTFNVDKMTFFKWVKQVDKLKYDHLQVLGLMLKQLFGFISFNSIGKNFRALTCNELILNFLVRFKIITNDLRDPDNWDLIMTDTLISDIKAGVYGN